MLGVIMIRTAVRRKSDGFLADIQTSMRMPAQPDTRLTNAVNEAGGTVEDWELVIVPDSAWEGVDTQNALYAETEGNKVLSIEQKPNTRRSNDSMTVQPSFQIAASQWKKLSLAEKVDALRDVLAAMQGID
jgi:hypothetical protein